MKTLKWSLLAVSAICVGVYTQKSDIGYVMLCLIFLIVLQGVMIADDKKKKK